MAEFVAYLSTITASCIRMAASRSRSAYYGAPTGWIGRRVHVANRAWTIPGTRMKAKREHRVPLCGRAGGDA